MVVIYRTPAEPAAFDTHYFDVHIPLAKKLPGLRRYEVSRPPIVRRAGAGDVYLIGTLHFDSMPEMHAAFATDAGRACAADRRVLAPNDADVQMYMFEAVDV